MPDRTIPDSRGSDNTESRKPYQKQVILQNIIIKYVAVDSKASIEEQRESMVR